MNGHHSLRRLADAIFRAELRRPEVFRVEVIAGLARRGESGELLDAGDALVRGPRFCACRLDERLLGEAVRVARAARLRAYDAVYVALALERNEPLFTLDGEVVARCQLSFPELRVFGLS